MPQLARAVSGAVVVSTRNRSAAADPNPAPVKYKPYSPFQNTSNAAEYAVARLDDLLNWGRKVSYIPCVLQQAYRVTLSTLTPSGNSTQGG